ncbi:MAG: hypothetical protein HZY73_10940 [Micropruina sp.]|nr:MAG: hypothetical protein HZY73_10940 [Micropruina sp.]
MGALGLLLYRALTGAWGIVSMVVIGVVACLLVLLLAWVWDNQTFARTLRTLAETGRYDLVVGGYLTSAEFRNVALPHPKRGEVILAANRDGLQVLDPRRGVPVVVLDWRDIIDLAPGLEPFLGQSVLAVVIATMEGRLGLVVRPDPRRGILSVGSAATGTVIEQIRRLRPGSRVD